jgi:hypothetical protein
VVGKPHPTPRNSNISPAIHMTTTVDISVRIRLAAAPKGQHSHVVEAWDAVGKRPHIVKAGVDQLGRLPRSLLVHQYNRQRHEMRGKSARSGAYLFFNAASQFVTSVRGMGPFGELGSVIRKRRPSAVTS